MAVNINKSTTFIGHLFQEESNLHKAISKINNGLSDTFFDDYIPKTYLHATIIYIGNSAKQYNATEINIFKDKPCSFKKLDFYGKTLVYVFEFDDLEYNRLMLETMDKHNPSEKEIHGDKRLHIAIGKFTNHKAKEWFCDNLMDDIDQIIRRIHNNINLNKINANTFTFSTFHLITVDVVKQYTSEIL